MAFMFKQFVTILLATVAAVLLFLIAFTITDYREHIVQISSARTKFVALQESGELRIKDWWQAAALIFWYASSPVEYRCKQLLKAGNWDVCQDQPFSVKKPCLVYSFGIANDFSFDDAMGRLGCEVHSFDPSMKRSDHRRNANVTFHAIGISGNDSNSFFPRRDSYVKQEQVWKIRTLKTLMRELGHEHRVLDVLKIDVEGHEWAVVQNIMDDDMLPKIKQFNLEWHLFPDYPAKSQYVELYRIYTKLKQTGMLEFKKGPHSHNFDSKKINIQSDVHFINTRFMNSG